MPGVSIADPGNPVPALGRDEGRAVDGQIAAVLAGAGRDRLFVRNARMRRRRDVHRERVATGAQPRGDVELAPRERALDRAGALAVEPYVGQVVDAVECQRQVAAVEAGGRVELGPVPVVLAAQRVGYREVVEPEVGVGIDAALDQRRQHRSRHDGRVPARGVEPRFRDLRTVAVAEFIGHDAHAPAVDRPAVRAERLEVRGVRRGRDALGRARRRVRVRQGPRILRHEQAAPGVLLPRPADADLRERDQFEFGARTGQCGDPLGRQRPRGKAEFRDRKGAERRHFYLCYGI